MFKFFGAFALFDFGKSKQFLSTPSFVRIVSNQPVLKVSTAPYLYHPMQRIAVHALRLASQYYSSESAGLRPATLAVTSYVCVSEIFKYDFPAR